MAGRHCAWCHRLPARCDRGDLDRPPPEPAAPPRDHPRGREPRERCHGADDLRPRGDGGRDRREPEPRHGRDELRRRGRRGHAHRPRGRLDHDLDGGAAPAAAADRGTRVAPRAVRRLPPGRGPRRLRRGLDRRRRAVPRMAGTPHPALGHPPPRHRHVADGDLRRERPGVPAHRPPAARRDRGRPGLFARSAAWHGCGGVRDRHRWCALRGSTPRRTCRAG